MHADMRGDAEVLSVKWWWDRYWQWSAWENSNPLGFAFYFRTPLFTFGRFYKAVCQLGEGRWSGWLLCLIPVFRQRRLYLIVIDRRRRENAP